MLVFELLDEIDSFFQAHFTLYKLFSIAIHVSTDLREELFILGEDWVVCEGLLVWLRL